MRMHAKRHDRTGKPVVCRLWIKPQTSDFHDFLLFFILLQLDRYSWQRSAATDGGCKDNTSKDPFSQCESLQVIRVQVKIE